MKAGTSVEASGGGDPQPLAEVCCLGLCLLVGGFPSPNKKGGGWEHGPVSVALNSLGVVIGNSLFPLSYVAPLSLRG